ncbi:hypothetical protein D3C87_1530410 [compost metagenome]
MGQFQQLTDGGAQPRQIEQHAVMAGDHRRADAGLPEPANQQRIGGVVRQGAGKIEGHGDSALFFPELRLPGIHRVHRTFNAPRKTMHGLSARVLFPSTNGLRFQADVFCERIDTCLARS